MNSNNFCYRTVADITSLDTESEICVFKFEFSAAVKSSVKFPHCDLFVLVSSLDRPSSPRKQLLACGCLAGRCEPVQVLFRRDRSFKYASPHQACDFDSFHAIQNKCNRRSDDVLLG